MNTKTTAPSECPSDADERKARRMAWVRVALGNAQMLFATATVVLALLRGMTVPTVVLLVVTCGLTLTSVWLFRVRPWWKGS